jgi:hypothetical protein
MDQECVRIGPTRDIEDLCLVEIQILQVPGGLALLGKPLRAQNRVHKARKIEGL